MPLATHTRPLSRNGPRKAINGNCQVLGGRVESAAPLLGSIKATVWWKVCDSILCVRGAKRNIIHTSLTLSTLELLQETGGGHTLRLKCPIFYFFFNQVEPTVFQEIGFLLFKVFLFLKNRNLATWSMSIVNEEDEKSYVEPWFLIFCNVSWRESVT